MRAETQIEWHFEQLRSEIKRLRQILGNLDVTDDERAIAQSQLDNYLSISRREGFRRITTQL